MSDLFSFLKTHSIFQALAIVLASFILAKLTDWIITRGIKRFTRRTRTDLDDDILGLLHKPLQYSFVLAGMGIALERVSLPSPFPFLAGSVIKTLAVLLWLIFGVRTALLLLNWMASQRGRFNIVQPDTKPLFDIAAQVILVGGALYFLMISWGIDVSAWLASAGIVGLAIGFAAKDTLANLFAGVFILADAPYKIGDWVVLDGGERGRVTKVGMRSTRILTRDDIEITVPNANIANSKIINESGGPEVKYRNRLPVGVAYGSDIDQVKAVLLECALAGVREGLICSDPEPRVRFREFGDSALLQEILYWIDDSGTRGLVQDWLNMRVYKALGETGIEIPYPKRDVYVRHLPGTSPAQKAEE